MPEIALRSVSGGICVDVIVSAGSSRSEVRGIHGNALKVAVRSAPEKGKANKEVEELLAEFFGVNKRSAAVIAGQTSRNKQMQVTGVTLEAARARIATLSP
jgi:uncharacterized protein (TIGR00251 family)